MERLPQQEALNWFLEFFQNKIIFWKKQFPSKTSRKTSHYVWQKYLLMVIHRKRSTQYQSYLCLGSLFFLIFFFSLFIVPDCIQLDLSAILLISILLVTALVTLKKSVTASCNLFMVCLKHALGPLLRFHIFSLGCKPALFNIDP
jgi:hypothetical protein